MIVYKAYLVTNLINGKRYVGVTKGPVQVRWAEHVREASNSKRARLFHRAIAKHGPENFSVEHMASARNRADLAALEIILIKQEGTFWVTGNGYNLTIGGEGPRGAFVSDATREKIRLSSLGRSLTEATKTKISAAATGRKHTAETKAKMSDARKAMGPLSEERRAVQAEILRNLTPEQREKGYAKLRGRKQTVEFVEKRIAVHRGRKRPLSTRLKQMAAWANRNPQKNLFPVEELMKTRP